jgi:mannose-1-phosphate guanylyltransferase
MSEFKNNYVLIMAGGIGSRFWPKSRVNMPKQFIDILGLGSSLLQLTYQRFLKVCPEENIYILTNELYEGLVKEQLPALSDNQVLLEPSRNNTAPCIAYAVYKIMELNPEANIVVAPSDHVILKEEVFVSKINQALDFTAANEAIVTLGIQPTRPDTGYGYINFKAEHLDGVHPVAAFMEKPEQSVAEQYVQEGNYLWNAGIFIWKASTIAAAFAEHATEIDALFTRGKVFYNTEGEKAFIAEYYPQSPNISIDYAILEKADNIYTIPAEIGWSDLGTWASLFEVAEKDESLNVVNSDKVKLSETKDCIVHLPEGKVAVIRGLENYIIVDDQEVLLIYPKAHEQIIKKESQEITERFGRKFA